MEQIMGQLSFYGPPKINANRRFRINPYGNNKKKKIKKPLMENLYIGNLTNDTKEE